MKKLIIIAVIFISFNSVAQINYGVHVGYCRVGGYDGYKYRGSAMAGLFLKYTKSKVLISVEANYIGRGAAWQTVYTDKAGNNIGTARRSINNRYLQVPLFIGGTIKTGNFNLFLQGGGFYSFLLDSKIMYIPPSGASTSRSILHDSNSLNDYGVIAAAGIEFKAKLFFEIRVERALSNAHRYMHGRNTAFSMMMGLRFGK